MNIPYEGEVEGLGYAYRGVSSSAYPINKSGTEKMYHVDTLNVCIIVDTVINRTAIETKVEADMERLQENMLNEMAEINKMLTRQAAAHTTELEGKARVTALERAAKEAEAKAEEEAKAAAEKTKAKAAAEKSKAEKAKADETVARHVATLKELSKDYAKAFVPVSTRVDRTKINIFTKEIERNLESLYNKTSDSSIKVSLDSVAKHLRETKANIYKDERTDTKYWTEFATRILQFISGTEESDSYGAFNISTAVTALDKNAQPNSIGHCARYVRLAIEAGGLSTEGRPGSATNYDVFLPKLGFSTIDSTNYAPEKGDIVVLKAFQGKIKNHEHGHIQMYDGVQWVSDFKQRDFWPGGDYRISKPKYVIFRWKKR
jgi:hypothetical protein